VLSASSAARLTPHGLLKTTSRAAIASERAERALGRLLERLSVPAIAFGRLLNPSGSAPSALASLLKASGLTLCPRGQRLAPFAPTTDTFARALAASPAIFFHS